MMRLSRFAAAGLALLVVSACGNDPDRQGSFAIALSTLASVGGPLFGGGEGPAPAVSTPEAIAAVLPQLPPGPVLRFEVPKLEQSAIAYTIRRSGGYRTFATVTGQTLTTRAGLLTSTRGFSWDLMSSATNGAADLIRRQSSGTVQRIYRFLSAMDDEIEMVATCSIGRDGSETITLASGARFSTTRMRETCRAGELTFTNRYWVTASGALPRSEQWVSEEIETLRIEVIRTQ